MQVILKQNIQGLGNIGQSVRVREGYARNFLLPNKMVMVASDENMKIILKQKEALAKKESEENDKALAKVRQIEKASYTIEVEAGEDEKLYGAVTNYDIAQAIVREGHDVDKKQIVLESPIKKLGIYDISVKIRLDVSATIKVFVVKK